jgi:hypothetical protein
MNYGATGVEPQIIATLHPTTPKSTTVRKVLCTPLFLLPLLPFLTLVVLTLLLRPYCHPLFPTPGAAQTCETYHTLSIILDIATLVGVMFALLMAWDRAIDDDLESGLASSEDVVGGMVIGASERQRLLPGPYTFGVRELPLLCDYGTMAGVDPEVSALLNFYHSPLVEDLRWCSPRKCESLYEPIGSSSPVQVPESSPIQVGESSRKKMDLGDPEILTHKDPLGVFGSWEAVEDDKGWTRWRWRRSTIVLSESPDQFML